MNVVFMVILCGCGSSFNPRNRLMVAPDKSFPISSIDQNLTLVLMENKPLLFYIHGRGDEPKKSVDKKILVRLEKEYGIKVLMFNWDSKGFVLSRPVERALESAPYLNEVVEKIVEFRKQHPESQIIPISLLVHSMGSIVLRKSLEADLNLSFNDEPIFTNILITGSDEDAQEHDKWIQKLKAKGTIILTFNENDGTLRWSFHSLGKTPLGKGPVPPLASNIYYLDVTGLVGTTHRLFLKNLQHNQVSICRIISSMIRSEPPDLGKTIIANIEQERILFPTTAIPDITNCFMSKIAFPDATDD